MERSETPTQCEQGLLISGSVLQGKAFVGETLLLEWTRGGKFRSVILAIETKHYSTGSVWVDTAEAAAGCEVRVTVADKGISDGRKKNVELALARFVFKDGAEGMAVMEGHEFLARVFVYSGEMKVGMLATCTFSSGTAAEATLKQIVWMEVEEAEEAGEETGEFGISTAAEEVVKPEKREELELSEEEEVATHKSSSRTAPGSAKCRVHSPAHLLPSCQALVLFQVQQKSGQEQRLEHQDMSCTALAPSAHCIPFGRFSIIDLDGDLGAAHHSRKTFVAIGEIQVVQENGPALTPQTQGHAVLA
jgi:hypothetical protein